MPQENDDCGQMQEPLIILRVIFVAHHQPPEVEQPDKEPFDLPSSSLAAQRPAILGGRVPIGLVGRNHLRAVVPHQRLVQPVAVVGFVPNQPLGRSATRRAAIGASTRFTSAGGALSARRARGSPAPSARPMTWGPLPRWVFPTRRPLFGPERMCRPQNTL